MHTALLRYHQLTKDCTNVKGCRSGVTTMPEQDLSVGNLAGSMSILCITN